MIEFLELTLLVAGGALGAAIGWSLPTPPVKPWLRRELRERTRR